MGDWPSHNPQPGGPGVALGLASTPQPGQLVEPARGLSPNRYSSQGHRDTQAPPPQQGGWLALTDPNSLSNPAILFISTAFLRKTIWALVTAHVYTCT